MSKQLAFIGLGTMGYPMAGHLQRAGHQVTVYNRNAEKAEKWAAEFGGLTAPTPFEAAAHADVVFTCVGNDEDVRAVTVADTGVIAALQPGAVLVDHTTASAALALELAAACSERNAAFIDAPVSGGQQGAENGQLTIMCGGESAVFDSVIDVLYCYAKAVTLLGATGSGQLTKMVNQICVAGVLQGLAEGLSFAEHAGLDLNKVITAISQGAAGSWQMTHRHASMIAGEYEHGFAVDWMRKDLDICLGEARRNGTDLSITAQINDYYRDVQAMGGGRWDTSSLYRRLQGRKTLH